MENDTKHVICVYLVNKIKKYLIICFQMLQHMKYIDLDQGNTVHLYIIDMPKLLPKQKVILAAALMGSAPSAVAGYGAYNVAKRIKKQLFH